MINDELVELYVPKGEGVLQQWELQHIFIDDPYQLSKITSKVSTVLDIGANIGCFSLCARSHFPNATIHSYEPNPVVCEVLRKNVAKIRVEVMPFAVSRYDGRANLVAEKSSLQGVVEVGDSGSVEVVSFSSAIERLGGAVDLLKLDCEGGEWSIFDDVASMAKVTMVTMEYHLECTGSSSTRRLDDLVRIVDQLGFRICYLRESTNRSVGQMFAVRDV